MRQRYLLKDYLRAAVNQVANAILAARKPTIWRESSTTCASASTLFGTWEGNLLARWHPRYKEKGVLIYWHVGKKEEQRTGRGRNNRLEQDHRGVKGRYKPMRRFKNPENAERFCQAFDEQRN